MAGARTQTIGIWGEYVSGEPGLIGGEEEGP